MTLTDGEEYLSEENARLAQQVAQLHQRLIHAREIVELSDDIIHKAGKIAQHLPYLVESLPEPSAELMQAALQLQTLLVQRKV